MSSSEATSLSDQIAALINLMKSGTTSFRLVDHAALLELVTFDASSEDQSRADTLLRAFREVGTKARASVLAQSEYPSKTDEAAQIAAAAEVLNLGDDRQFLASFATRSA